jgi:type II secretory pathway component PulJ
MRMQSPESLNRAPSPRRRRGYSIIECLVYGFVLVILLGVAYAAFYRCMDNSVALRRNAEDISRALSVGERWRADIRAAVAAIEREATDDGELLHLKGGRGPVDYQFVSNSVSRRVKSGPWVTVLANVKTSAMAAEARGGVTAWRWELELKPRSKKPVRMAPLFTFIAVPERKSSP